MSTIDKFNYTYEMMRNDFANFYKKNVGFKNSIANADIVLALSRGGLIVGQYIGYIYDKREVYGLPIIGYNDETDTEKRFSPSLDKFIPIIKNKNVLIVDDICDTGKTLNFIIGNMKDKCKNITSFALFGKSNSIVDYYVRKHTGQWINFPWDLDIEYIKGGQGG